MGVGASRRRPITVRVGDSSTRCSVGIATTDVAAMTTSSKSPASQNPPTQVGSGGLAKASVVSRSAVAGENDHDDRSYRSHICSLA
jgi:hypothetical protein